MGPDISLAPVALVALVVAGLVGWAARRTRLAHERQRDSWQERALSAEARALALAAGHQEAQARAALDARTLGEVQARLEATLCDLAAARAADLAHQQEVRALTEVRATFADHFRTLSQEVLAEKTALFERQQRESVARWVDPLRAELGTFRARVEEVWRRDGEERAGLGERLTQVAELARGMGAEARALSQALRGDHRAVGDWGEVVLARILSTCGLRPGIDFEEQRTLEGEEGQRLRPDVIVHLPDARDIVIDAKVSLGDYYDRVRAPDAAAARAAAEKLALAMRAHVRALSAKNYAALPGLRTLDCTLLFVPIEPAFLCALEVDPGLWEQAWEKKIVLTSPTTLVCMLRIVEDQWRQARQSQHALDIAERGARLYDKFCGLMEDVVKLGQRLDQARDAYLGMRTKISEGRGSLVGQFELLRKKGGLKSQKRLPPAIASRAAAQDADLDGETDIAPAPAPPPPAAHSDADAAGPPPASRPRAAREL